jgi:hypothetical protein
VQRFFVLACLIASFVAGVAQTPASLTSKSSATAPAAAAPSSVKDLPVRKVVLYKNGIGYFEHAGTVTGNQRVTIDFTSPQLNDVLQSLTALDEGGGRIAGVNYNSTTPLAEQLKTLSLGMTDDPTSTELFQALRGQRVEVTGGPGGTITGRLMSIESRTEKTGGDNAATVEKNFLTLVAGSGAVRVIELTPQLSVRPLGANLQGQLDRYLELLSTTHANGLRHLTLNATGAGERTLRVSYISEVPVWKSTYRIVFPRAAESKEYANAIVQGWAVVDNTVGADWDNVQLSLVAGAPQSFIQPLSQPLYTRRPEIPISMVAQTTPQTHEAGQFAGPGEITGIVTDATGAVVPGARVTLTSQGTGAKYSTTSGSTGLYDFARVSPGTYTLTFTSNGFQNYKAQGLTVRGGGASRLDAKLSVGAETQTVAVEADAMAVQSDSNVVSTLVNSQQIHGIATENKNFAALASLGMGVSSASPAGGMGYFSGVDRPSDAINEGDVSTNAFDEFFEYSLAAPVTIHKNESAMVPILQQELPCEHVTLWNPKDRLPLRAIWLQNKSKLTLDSGSFSIFESGEFAGEGLLDPIHPDEKRLLSYAADQAMRVHAEGLGGTNRNHHLSIHKGLIVETFMDLTGTAYEATNSGDEDRTVLIEHPRKSGAGWALDGDLKAAETTPALYRMRLAVPAHVTAKLEVREHGPQTTVVDLRTNPRQEDFVLTLTKQFPNAAAQLQPVIDAQGAVTDLDAKIAASKTTEQTAAADEQRDRENVTALKGSDAAKRFVDELNRAEDQLQAARKQTADLEKQRDAALEKLDQVIAGLSLDWDEAETK